MALLLSLSSICICSTVWAEPDENSEETENLAGDAWFDYAFRDEVNQILRGTVGGKKSERIVQNGEDSENEQDTSEDSDDDSEEDSKDIGLGLSGNSEPFPVKESVSSIGKDQFVRIEDLELECAELEFCQKKENVDALLRATGLELGHLTTGGDLALSIERLRKTGFFSNIHQEVTVRGDRISVKFKTVPHTIIQKVIIDKRGSLYESEVRKRMILRPGGALYPRTAILRGMDVDDIPREKLIQMALEDQEKSLTRVYSKEGYFDTEVKITAEESGPYLVDLHVSAEHAESYVLGKVYVRGHHAKNYAKIEDVFRSEFSFFGGVTKAEIEDAVDAVLMFYRNDGYYQTKIDFVSRRQSDRKTVDVFLDITENERWEIQFSGNEALNQKELKSVLTFSDSGYVDAAEVLSSCTALEQLYVSAGYYKARVRGEIIRPDSGRKKRNAAKKTKLEGVDPELARLLEAGPAKVPSVVVFTIEEGERYEIGEISFAGLKELTRDELLNVISSTEYSAFGSGAYPQRAMIADDAAKIVDLYRERGYLNADVPSWTLKPMENGRLQLEFLIQAGEQSHFYHRQIRYTDREQYDKFDVTIEPPENDVFSDSLFRTERAAITKQLRARGHATISDRVHCTSYAADGRVASEDTCDIAEFSSACMPDDLVAMCEIKQTREGEVEYCLRHFKTENNLPDAPECVPKNGITGTEIDVEYEVTLGPKYSFGDTFVHGNVVTRDWVVRQDIPFKSGDTFDINKVIDSRSLFRRRQIYKSASLNVIGVDDDLATQAESGDSTSTAERSVPLVVNLEEGERRWFDFALGIQETGGDWILAGEMEYVEANLLGTGWDLRVLLMPEARFLVNNDQWVGFTKFNQNFFMLLTLSIPVIPASGFNIISQLFYDLRYIPDTNKEEYGWLVELQWNVSKTWFAALAFELESSKTSSFGIDVSDDISEYNACYPFTFFMNCPFSSADDAFTVSLTPRVSYDGRDNPLTPKSGFYVEGKIKLGYSSAVGFYAKPEARASYIQTFLKYFTLAFNLRFGVSFLGKDKDLPYIDRYFLGGLNMRGYDNDALGPRRVNVLTPNYATNEAGGGEVLFNFTTELRYPIWESVGIYGALFVDMGALTPHQPTFYSAGEFAEELFSKQMRYTAGLGLRWQISDSIPPIVIDYGFILNRRRGDPLGGFSLNVGYTF